MEGVENPPELRGIIPRSFAHIFDVIGATEDAKYLVRASMLEIYNEDIRDLLDKQAKNRKELKENPDTGVFVKGLASVVCSSKTDLDRVFSVGTKNRTTGATQMNQDSSRSHSICTVIIEKQSKGVDKQDHICQGKLNLVDLAGSERQSKTGATGDRLKEAAKINQSLSSLGNVISALVEAKTHHIPYRDSKLTRLLQDSLGGNAKTVMIANIGPADYNFDETINTLRYANRAKNIKNKPRINEDPKDAMLRQFQEELEKLRAQLEEGGISLDDSGTGPEVVTVTKEVVKQVGMSAEEVEAEKQRLIEQQQKDLKQSAEDEKLLQEQIESREKALEERRAQQAELAEKMKEKRTSNKEEH